MRSSYIVATYILFPVAVNNLCMSVGPGMDVFNDF